MNLDQKEVNKKSFSDWKKYHASVYLLKKGQLTEFEAEFIDSIDKFLWNLSDKQRDILDRIIIKYFTKKGVYF